MTDTTRIQNGTVYDPANGIDGEVRDLWIADGKIMETPTEVDCKPTYNIDASGLVVMPGGVDMHCHIAGPKVNAARKMQPEEKRPVRRTGLTRSGTDGSVPSTFTTGYKYLGLGYTTAFDAAVPPLHARHVHDEFADTPCIDKGFFVMVGNNHFVMNAIKRGDDKGLRNFLGWLIGSAKGYAPKIVNPGGPELWKQKPTGNATDLDQPIDHFDVTPRQIIESVVRASNSIGLPHPAHIHCNNLGIPGNWTTTLETMKAINGHRAHLTHIQFHSYGGGDAEEQTLRSKVEPLADFVNSSDHLTVDVGQVMFGPTTSMTGDSPLGYYLQNVSGSKWFASDTELESGCGVSPIEYKNKSLVHALQWAIGLEWYLMVNDPWKVAMSTDHPNGGSFMAYPQIIRLLMDSAFRREALASVNPRTAELTQLANLDREYSLNEIAIITRAGPARMLGLKHKGHLGPGADADITIYLPNENRELMFSVPSMVIKDGVVVVENGEIRKVPDGSALFIEPGFDSESTKTIEDWFSNNYSVQFSNYGIDTDSIHRGKKLE